MAVDIIARGMASRATGDLSKKADLVNGKVPASQLPSYVDDVIEGYYYNNKFYQDAEHTIEITGETGKIYVDLTSSRTYRWSGTTYVLIGGTEGTPVFLATYNVTSYNDIITAFNAGKIVMLYDPQGGKYSNGVVVNLCINNTTASDPFIGFGGTADDRAYYAYIKQSAGWYKLNWNVQRELISGTNIKTINGTSILGSGDITVTGEPDEYLKSATVSGNKLILTKKDGTTQDFEPIYTAGNGIDITDNVISLDDDASIAIYDNRIADANKWLTNGYTKTRNVSEEYETATANLPSVCTGADRWGVLLYVAENNENKAGLQQYFPIDGTYKGRLFYRSVTGWGAGMDPEFGEWELVPWSSEKQDILVSGTNIKTINNQSVLGSGNIDISLGDVSAADVTYTKNTTVSTAVGGLKAGFILTGHSVEEILERLVGAYVSPTFTSSSMSAVYNLINSRTGTSGGYIMGDTVKLDSVVLTLSKGTDYDSAVGGSIKYGNTTAYTLTSDDLSILVSTGSLTLNFTDVEYTLPATQTSGSITFSTVMSYNKKSYDVNENIVINEANFSINTATASAADADVYSKLYYGALPADKELTGLTPDGTATYEGGNVTLSRKASLGSVSLTTDDDHTLGIFVSEDALNDIKFMTNSDIANWTRATKIVSYTRDNGSVCSKQYYVYTNTIAVGSFNYELS